MSPGADLFARHEAVQALAPGMFLLRRFVDAARLLPAVQRIAARAPFRHLHTPGGGRMSVAMTNCGDVGWVSDRRGYRYDAIDPLTGEPWPPMPAGFLALAIDAAARAGFPGLAPDVCLINRYAAGSRLGAHQDRDEGSFDHPIVSVSMGLPATFLLYGASRGGRAQRIALEDGDVLVLGGPSRKAFHGVGALKPGQHPQTGSWRFNLTFRRAR